MTVYLTKVWGFDIPAGPLQFSTAGWREKAREMLKQGDLVVLVGTKGEQTLPDDRGYLLGLMEPTLERASSLDFTFPTRELDFTDGEYRWPYALLNRKAWKFLDPRPELEDVSNRAFNMDAASGIVALTDAEAEKVLAFPKAEVELLLSTKGRAKVEGDDAARRRGAPPPTTRRAGVMHLRRAPAQTYCMRIANASTIAFKIGWAFDFRMRERTFNQSALPALGGLRYQTVLRQLWDTAMQAFEMEQALLRHFDSARHKTNREVLTGIPLEVIQLAWVNFMRHRRTH